MVSALQYSGTEGSFPLAKIVTSALNHQYEGLHEQLSRTSDFAASDFNRFHSFANLQVSIAFHNQIYNTNKTGVLNGGKSIL